MPQHSIKEEARRIIDHLPEQATYEDLMYELYVREKIELGLKSAEDGKTFSSDEVLRNLARDR